jgi:DNA-binding NarL/FixJ family response regulator
VTGSLRHVLTSAEGARGNSPAGRAKAAATKAYNAAERRRFVIEAHAWGLVDGAIAREAGLSETTVAKILYGRRVRPKYGRGYITRGS